MAAVWDQLVAQAFPRERVVEEATAQSLSDVHRAPLI